MGLDLSAEQIAALESRAEGSIAALQLAAVSMRGRDDVQGFISAFTGNDRYIVDYLVEEVLERQPEGVRNFLLQTSILDRLSASLGDAVTGRTDTRAQLERLDRANLFLIPLDDLGHCYRYHHLFADVLRGAPRGGAARPSGHFARARERLVRGGPSAGPRDSTRAGRAATSTARPTWWSGSYRASAGTGGRPPPCGLARRASPSDVAPAPRPVLCSWRLGGRACRTGTGSRGSSPWLLDARTMARIDPTLGTAMVVVDRDELPAAARPDVAIHRAGLALVHRATSTAPSSTRAGLSTSRSTDDDRSRGGGLRR